MCRQQSNKIIREKEVVYFLSINLVLTFVLFCSLCMYMYICYVLLISVVTRRWVRLDEKFSQSDSYFEINVNGIARHPEILGALGEHALHWCFNAVSFATNDLITENWTDVIPFTELNDFGGFVSLLKLFVSRFSSENISCRSLFAFSLV